MGFYKIRLFRGGGVNAVLLNCVATSYYGRAYFSPVRGHRGSSTLYQIPDRRLRPHDTSLSRNGVIRWNMGDRKKHYSRLGLPLVALSTSILSEGSSEDKVFSPGQKTHRLIETEYSGPSKQPLIGELRLQLLEEGFSLTTPGARVPNR